MLAAARHLLENLSFWREESHRELSKIIDLHNAAVNKSINDMVEEVCHLQIKLSEIEKERDGLRETLEAMKCDRKMSQENYMQGKKATEHLQLDDPDGEGRMSISRQNFKGKVLDEREDDYQIGVVQHSRMSLTQQIELEQDSINENDATFGIIGQVSKHDRPNEDATEKMDEDKVDEKRFFKFL